MLPGRSSRPTLLGTETPARWPLGIDRWGFQLWWKPKAWNHSFRFVFVVLTLLGVYRREDLLAALERAVRYGAFSAKSIERILPVQARPKTALERMAEEKPSHLGELLSDNPTPPRPTTEYHRCPQWKAVYGLGHEQAWPAERMRAVPADHPGEAGAGTQCPAPRGSSTGSCTTPRSSRSPARVTVCEIRPPMAIRQATATPPKVPTNQNQPFRPSARRSQDGPKRTTRRVTKLRRPLAKRRSSDEDRC